MAFQRNMDPKKCPMPSQDPNVRNKNFEEVALGYTYEMAVNEARRCLHCKNKPCVSACPVAINIPDFIERVTNEDMEGAYQIISMSSSLPAVCGRVCPQETQCEGKCVRGIKGEAVGIGRLERFVADWHREHTTALPEKPVSNGHKVAIIGAGPSGLTAAGDLAKLGYQVTVFEALHLAGGVLVYGIPEFRLPKAIVQKEIDNLKALGVDIETNMVIGKVLTVDELFERGYEAIFIGSGAGLPRFMGIPGESLKGVYSANEYLTRINLMKAYLPDSKTPIILGFNYHEKNYEPFPQNFPGKTLIVSESTSALMTRGYYQMPSDSMYVWPNTWRERFDRPEHLCSAYDNCHVPWGSTHEVTWREVKRLPYVSGMFIWTGFDYLGEPTPYWWPSRSSFFGIVDLAGIPKDGYYMYQSEWTDTPVLHLFPHWNWKKGETVDVWAYYNRADEVELFLNGESLGVKSKPDDAFHVCWRVPFTPGTLKAVSRRDGKEVLTREIRTAGEPARIMLIPDRSALHADGTDLSFVTVEIQDKDGNLVPYADNLLRFTVEGDGFIAGTDNGDQNDPVSLKKPERHAFYGKAMAVIQNTGKAGTIRLKATAEGLPDAIVEIKVGE